jgi:hypothetical protein
MNNCRVFESICNERNVRCRQMDSARVFFLKEYMDVSFVTNIFEYPVEDNPFKIFALFTLARKEER